MKEVDPRLRIFISSNMQSIRDINRGFPVATKTGHNVMNSSFERIKEGEKHLVRSFPATSTLIMLDWYFSFTSIFSFKANTYQDKEKNGSKNVRKLVFQEIFRQTRLHLKKRRFQFSCNCINIYARLQYCLLHLFEKNVAGIWNENWNAIRWV